MKLRTKVNMFILLAWIIMFALVLFGIKEILIDNYLSLENKVSKAAADRINGAIEQKLVAVEGTGITWSVWDDAYNFAVGKNPGFIKQVFTPASMSAANVDVALVFTPEGNLVYKKALNSDRTDFMDVPANFDDAFKKQGNLWKYIINPTVKSADKGLYLVDDKIIMMAIHAILKSDGTGSPNGTFVVAKWFTESDWNDVKKATKMNADIYSIAMINDNDLLKSKYNFLTEQHQSNNIERIDKNTLYEYVLIKDINANPIGMYKIILPRDLYQQSMKSIYTFTILFMLLGVILILLLSYLLQKIIINRLEKINNEIISVGKTKNFERSIDTYGHDEVSFLTAKVNKMFSTIKKYDEQNKQYLQDIKNELEKSNILGKKLKQAEVFHSDIINSMPSMMIIIDGNKKILQLNHSSEEKINITTQEAKEKSVFDLFPILSKYEEKIDKVMIKNEPDEIYKVSQIEQGNTQYFDILFFPLSKEKMMAIRIDNVTDLVKLQETFLQNEKLASIGVITAGVIYEINTPISFFISAADQLQIDMDKIIQYIKKYIDLKPSDNIYTEINEINKYGNNINYEAMLKDINKKLDDIQINGANIASIVKNLQLFARMDEDTKKKYDVNEGIESTLRLLSHRISNKVKVTKQYGSISQIECFPGRMNQVFMSLISNALDAMEDEGGELTIKTEAKNNHTIISIKDTGVGIKTEDMAKIFEPLFTTKETNKSMGLGLSSVRTILEEINGKVELNSQVGKGTEFVISILNQADSV